MADYFVHESSYVDNGAQIGKNTRIWHFSHIMKGAIVGDHCTIGQNVNIDGEAILGRKVKVTGTPTVFVNGRRLRKPSMDNFHKVIGEQLESE